MRNFWLLVLATALSIAPPKVRANEVAPAATGVLVTGRALSINGQTQIPRGLFGVHATALSEKTAREWGVEMVRLIHLKPPSTPTVPGARADVPANVNLVLDSFWDRYQPAPLLYDPQWQKKMETLARDYAQAAKASTRPVMVEYWNEPYLNWAIMPGVNYDGAFYEQASTTPGEKMMLKGQAAPTEFMVWDKPRLVAIDLETKRIDYVATRYIPEKIENRPPQAGDTFMFRGQKTFRLELRPWGKDVSQRSHYSAGQNSLYYRQMFLPFAKALKATNPNVQLIGGWGCHLQYGNWDAWHTLYKPLLDDAREYLDGLNEHHYGQDTRMVAGAYETVAAYAKTAFGKDLKFYNTEAGGSLDPEQPGNIAKPNFDAKSYADLDATMTYTLRDILHLLSTCPDKAVTRVSHMADKNGDRFAFQLLKDLRGDLVETKSSNPNVSSVAAHNGSTLVVALWNEARSAQVIPLQVTPPAGWAIQIMTRREASRAGETIEIREAPMELSAPVDLGARRAVILKFEMIRKPVVAVRERMAQTQFFAGGILKRVKPGESQSFWVALPEEKLKKAQNARVRFVIEGNTKGFSCRVNGVLVASQIANSYTNEVEIPASLLRLRNLIEFHCNSGNEGFQMDCASLITSAVDISR
jgi:hypothetical protein